MPKGCYPRTIEHCINIRAAKLKAGKRPASVCRKISQSVKKWHEERKNMMLGQNSLVTKKFSEV